MKRARTDSNDDSDDSKTEDIEAIQKHCDEATKKMRETIDEMNHKMNELRSMKEDWLKICDEMKVNAAKAESKIVFDVGGQRFATTKETLLRQPDTYFTAMLSSDSWKVVSFILKKYV